MSGFDRQRLPVNQDNQDYARTIPPNQSVNLAVVGDFVFCKFATSEVDLVINGKTVSVEAGDIRRTPSIYENIEIRNNNDFDAVVVLVAGFGEFSRQIVKGEIEVVPGIRGADGRFRDDLRQEIALTVIPQYPPELVTVSAGDLLATMPITQNKNGNNLGNVAGMWVAGGLLRVAYELNNFDMGVITVDSDMNVQADEIINKFGLSNYDAILGNTGIGDDGYIFVDEGARGNRVMQSVDGSAVTFINLPGAPGRIGQLRDGGFFVYYRGSANRNAGRFLEFYNFQGDKTGEILAGQVDELSDTESNGQMQWFVQDPLTGHWAGQRAGRVVVYNADCSERLRVINDTSGFFEGGGSSGGGPIFPVNRAIFAKPNQNFRLRKWQIEDEERTLSANVFAPGCDNPLIRRDISNRKTTAKIEADGVAGNTTLSGQIIKAMLELYYNAEIPDAVPYMDSVYSFKIEGQRGNLVQAERQSNAGTLLGAGVVDDFTAVFPATVRMTVDSNLRFTETLE